MMIIGMINHPQGQAVNGRYNPQMLSETPEIWQFSWGKLLKRQELWAASKV